MRRNFGIGHLLIATTSIALGMAWRLDHQRQAREINELRRESQMLRTKYYSYLDKDFYSRTLATWRGRYHRRTEDLRFREMERLRKANERLKTEIDELRGNRKITSSSPENE
jgi:hypothetical protein